MASERPRISGYPYVTAITTRWTDNDVYGHINNVAYYSFFDTAANRFLIEHGLDIARSAIIGIVAESKCQYHAPLAYPQTVLAGVRVDRLGERAVTYGIGIFDDKHEEAAAHGHFVHVFVNRETFKPSAIPVTLRNALATLAS